MKIRNKRKGANYLNYKVDGFAKKTLIPAGTTLEIVSLTNKNQILNFGDFTRGFFEIVEDGEYTKNIESEDTLEKVEKEVKNYTDNNTEIN